MISLKTNSFHIAFYLFGIVSILMSNLTFFLKYCTKFDFNISSSFNVFFLIISCFIWIIETSFIIINCDFLNKGKEGEIKGKGKLLILIFAALKLECISILIFLLVYLLKCSQNIYYLCFFLLFIICYDSIICILYELNFIDVKKGILWRKISFYALLIPRTYAYITLINGVLWFVYAKN